jgi:endonuclease-8
MPEGDTIKRAEAMLRPLLVGRRLVAVYDHGLRRGALAGQSVTGVKAIGKHLLVELDGGFTLRVHLEIAGAWRRRRASELREVEARAATLALVTDEDALLAVKARAAEIVRTAFVHAHPAIAALGPDLLGDGPLDVDTIGARPRRRSAVPHRR